MSELALHGSIARRLLGPVLLYGAFAAVLVVGESRIQILLDFVRFSKSVMSVLVVLGAEMHQPSTVAYLETFAAGRVNPVD